MDPIKHLVKREKKRRPETPFPKRKKKNTVKNLFPFWGGGGGKKKKEAGRYLLGAPTGRGETGHLTKGTDRRPFLLNE